MKNIILVPIVLLSIFYSGCGLQKDIEEIAEKAYFEGQRDYMEGDIRIGYNADGCYYWTKSPWDSGSTPTYNPSVVCDVEKRKNKNSDTKKEKTEDSGIFIDY